MPHEFNAGRASDAGTGRAASLISLSQPNILANPMTQITPIIIRIISPIV